VTMRFFDEENNFLGGMFDNHWAYVIGEDWKINVEPNKIEIRHKEKNLFVKIEKKESLYIAGAFYFDGIRVEARNDALVLPKNNKMIGNTLVGYAFSVFGDKRNSGFAIGGIKL